jgi:hypothetical protein
LPLVLAHALVLWEVVRVFSREEQSVVYLGGLDRLLAMLMTLSLLAIVVLALTWWQRTPQLDARHAGPAAAAAHAGPIAMWSWGLCAVHGGIALALVAVLAWVDSRPWPS